ncbi:AraC-type DNA-binding protein [Rhizobiales bacterium GAS191]|nr:AraC-type DNA-binding protein [Rhizobiales bacterium GAS191]
MRSSNAADYQHVPRPLAVMAQTFPPGYRGKAHAHPRAQFLHAITGVMRVAAAKSVWVIPPDRGLWIPPGTIHAVQARGAVEVRTIYLARAAIGALPSSCCVLITTPLLRHLILAALEEPVNYDEAGRGGLIFKLMQDELSHLPRTPLGVPIPHGKRLKSACDRLLANPASRLGLEELAREVGASPRTLAREFAAETGLSFTAWRNRLRLAEASAQLAEGLSVAEVARRCGYGSPSAFTAMMRRTLGAGPRDVRAQPARGKPRRGPDDE